MYGLINLIATRIAKDFQILFTLYSVPTPYTPYML